MPKESDIVQQTTTFFQEQAKATLYISNELIMFNSLGWLIASGIQNSWLIWPLSVGCVVASLGALKACVNIMTNKYYHFGINLKYLKETAVPPSLPVDENQLGPLSGYYYREATKVLYQRE